MPQQSSSRPRARSEHHASTGQQVNELKSLVVGYAKQETVDPLRKLGRYLGFGFAGSAAMGIGVAFLLLALLRGLQKIAVFNEVGEISGGTYSWAPYLITSAAGLLVAVLFLWRLFSMAKRRGS